MTNFNIAETHQLIYRAGQRNGEASIPYGFNRDDSSALHFPGTCDADATYGALSPFRAGVGITGLSALPIFSPASNTDAG